MKSHNLPFLFHFVQLLYHNLINIVKGNGQISRKDLEYPERCERIGILATVEERRIWRSGQFAKSRNMVISYKLYIIHHYMYTYIFSHARSVLQCKNKRGNATYPQKLVAWRSSQLERNATRDAKLWMFRQHCMYCNFYAFLTKVWPDIGQAVKREFTVSGVWARLSAVLSTGS